MIGLLKNMLSGMGSVLRIPASPLYRYPYRQSGEGLRSDWLKIGKDVQSTLYEDDRENRK